MANQSIFAAFERMWQHVTNALSGKANASHTHDYIPNSLKGAANGLAELDSLGRVPSSQLPSYVDDVLEYTSKSSFPTTGESGKIYVDTATNKTYRWSGSAYTEISASLALGETSSTAYRGDRGRIAYDHSQAAHAPADAEKNQNAFSIIKVGSTTVVADTTTDTLELVGSNVTLTPDATNDKVTIGITKTNVTTALGYTPPTTDNNTTYDLAASTSSANGNVKLNLKAGGSGSGTDSVTIKGSGATSVTTDANGVITISSTDNDTKYTHPTSHPASMITGLATVATSGKYSDLSGKPTIPTKTSQLTNDSGFKTTDNNTTYTVATGDSNGQIKVTPSSGSAYNVSVKGLGSAAYTASTAYDAAGAASGVQGNLNSHTGNKSNPHGVTAAQVGALPTTGGTLTGNLTGQYLMGTWLQTTAATKLGSTSNRICVLDGAGWVYYRTPADILSDIGAAPTSHSHSYNDLSNKPTVTTVTIKSWTTADV